MDSGESSLLPFGVLEEILCRVPSKSLVRFKLTCKRWLALFQDQRFIYKHLAHIDQEQIIRTTDNDMVKIIDPVTGACSSLSLPQEFIDKSDIYSMIHCNGLMLCILENLDFCSLAVWNPYLNQVRWIEPLVSYPVCCYHGFGYDGYGYKIMRFLISTFTTNEPGNMESYTLYVHLYSFRTRTWIAFEESLDWHVVRRCKGVSLKGNMYWIAKLIHNPDMFIQCFNFSTEKFEPLCSLPFIYDATLDVVVLSAFRGDNLSLLRKSNGTTTIEVWVTDKIRKGVITSWTKFFNVTRPDLPVLSAGEDITSPMHFIDKNNRIVICCEEVVGDGENVAISIYLIEDGEIKRQGEIHRNKIGFSWPHECGYAYLPSLVSVHSKYKL